MSRYLQIGASGKPWTLFQSWAADRGAGASKEHAVVGAKWRNRPAQAPNPWLRPTVQNSCLWLAAWLPSSLSGAWRLVGRSSCDHVRAMQVVGMPRRGLWLVGGAGWGGVAEVVTEEAMPGRVLHQRAPMVRSTSARGHC